MQRALYLVAYDVRAPGRLRRILHVIKDYASGGQKSAFECYLSESERQELIKRAGHTLELEVDAFVLVRLAQKKPAALLGVAVAPTDQSYTYLG